MENQFVPGSNTLSNALRLAAGYCIDFKLMPTSTNENGEPVDLSFVLKFTPITENGKTAKALPDFKGTLKLADLDAEFTNDIYQIFQGDLATNTHRLGDYNKALEKGVKSASAAIVKPGETMPPPTGRKEGEPAKTGPKKPEKPKKPGIELVESQDTGPNAPVQAPAQADTKAATANDDVISDAVLVEETPAPVTPQDTDALAASLGF